MRCKDALQITGDVVPGILHGIDCLCQFRHALYNRAGCVRHEQFAYRLLEIGSGNERCHQGNQGAKGIRNRGHKASPHAKKGIQGNDEQDNPVNCGHNRFRPF